MNLFAEKASPKELLAQEEKRENETLFKEYQKFEKFKRELRIWLIKPIERLECIEQVAKLNKRPMNLERKRLLSHLSDLKEIQQMLERAEQK